MDVIGAYIRGHEIPEAAAGCVRYRKFDSGSSRRIKYHGFIGERPLVVLFPSGVGSNVRAAIDVVVAVGRATLIAMQPSAVCAEGDEIGERRLAVIPHT